MNISSINNAYDAGKTGGIGNIAANRADTLEPSAQNLSKITDTASLSKLLPRLQGLLEAIDHPDNNVLASMSKNISYLQDAFVDTMYNTVVDEGIDFSYKLTLRLNQENALEVSGEHPDKEKIESLLAGRPELSAAFKEIASQSELLRDVSNIGKLIGSQSGAKGYENAYNMHKNASYQFSIKGEMSHFYFIR